MFLMFFFPPPYFSLISTTIDSGFTGVNTDINSRISGPNTPMTPSSIEMGPRFPSTTAVSTEGCRYQIASPQTSNNGNPVPPNTGTYEFIRNVSSRILIIFLTF